MPKKDLWVSENYIFILEYICSAPINKMAHNQNIHFKIFYIKCNICELSIGNEYVYISIYQPEQFQQKVNS